MGEAYDMENRTPSNRNGRNKAILFACLVAYIALVAPSVYGMARFFTGMATGGSCTADVAIVQPDGTYIQSAVISLNGDGVVVKDMSCAKFNERYSEERPLNLFRYAHPYFALYSLLVCAGTLVALVSWPLASFGGFLSRRLVKRKQNC
jgi:hypothetical protein